MDPSGGKKWLLVDGHNMAFRCFYGVPPMTAADGTAVNAIHGWVRSLWKLEDMLRPDAVCVFFDVGGSVVRRDILSTYKANRAEMPGELRDQLPYLGLLSIAHGYHVIAIEGIEADDLLATFAARVANDGGIAHIASGDKDFAQCVRGNVFQLLPPTADGKGTWRSLDRDGVKEKFGVFPEQIVDYLSLLGDAADNIRGVPGIGRKWAEELLTQFGSVDGLLSHLGEVRSGRIRKSLEDSRDLIARNRRLIALNSICDFKLPEAAIQRNVDDIFYLLDRLQLRSLSTIAHGRYSPQGELFPDSF